MMSPLILSVNEGGYGSFGKDSAGRTEKYLLVLPVQASRAATLVPGSLRAASIAARFLECQSARGPECQSARQQHCLSLASGGYEWLGGHSLPWPPHWPTDCTTSSRHSLNIYWQRRKLTTRFSEGARVPDSPASSHTRGKSPHSHFLSLKGIHWLKMIYVVQLYD